MTNAKFCQKCGCAVGSQAREPEEKRQQEYVGKIYKCPNCGELLKSFVRNCPACGLELRGVKATSAVKEFALKLEAIESRRVYERPRGFFTSLASSEHVSKTDEQKISLIQSFTVPNTTEDILEFLILATSNVNMRLFDSFNTISNNSKISKSEQAIKDAWISKIKQTYQKARHTYGEDTAFQGIKSIYDTFNSDVKKSRRKGIIKLIFLFGWMPLTIIILALTFAVLGPRTAKEENLRLEAIEHVALESLEDGEYKKALLNAEALEYRPRISNGNVHEQERQWNIKRELLIDRIIDEAAENGVLLERPPQDENIKDVADSPN